MVRGGLFDCTRMLRGVCASPLPQRGKVGECQHVLEFQAIELRSLFLVLAEHADGLGVLGDIPGVLWRVVHIDRSADCPDQPQREIKEHPLEAGRSEDRECVPFPHPESEQAVGNLVDRLGRLRPGHRAPVLALLDEVGRPGEVPGDGVLP